MAVSVLSFCIFQYDSSHTHSEVCYRVMAQQLSDLSWYIVYVHARTRLIDNQVHSQKCMAVWRVAGNYVVSSCFVLIDHLTVRVGYSWFKEHLWRMYLQLLHSTSCIPVVYPFQQCQYKVEDRFNGEISYIKRHICFDISLT